MENMDQFESISEFKFLLVEILDKIVVCLLSLLAVFLLIKTITIKTSKKKEKDLVEIEDEENFWMGVLYTLLFTILGFVMCALLILT